jgi:alcohol dehydrogenase
MAHSTLLEDRARALLTHFRAGTYAYGPGSLAKAGPFCLELGKRPLVIANRSSWLRPTVDKVMASLREAGVTLAYDGVVPGSRPNSPSDDVYRIALYILKHQPDSVVAVGGGSTIDAAKAAVVAASFAGVDPELDHYYGAGLVKQKMDDTDIKLIPMLAVMTASGSGAHLTKYANVTDYFESQKRLIIDGEITPARAIFDYSVTASASRDLMLDGAFDGLSHCLEVFYGASETNYELIREIAETGIDLIISGVLRSLDEPGAPDAANNLGLGTDLGAYAIMVGGTNGAHLNSFSFVDITSHGRACAVMNPYYTVFFAPAIERQLRVVGAVYARHGFIKDDLDKLPGRKLGLAVAGGMQALSRRVGFPTRLGDLPGFSDAHIDRALAAAKTPQLESKLRNMPVAMTAEDIDTYMGPLLHAAAIGDFGPIKNMTK